MIKLQRILDKPILTPVKEHKWESAAVLNPGVFYDGELVHMLYRATSTWDSKTTVSQFGYAVSKDGINFYRFDKPVYEKSDAPEETRGVEDPRITLIDNTFYILYTGYSGKNYQICGASTKNFITYKRLGIVLQEDYNKDAAFFPGKINNKYVLLHRRMPNIWIAFSDDMKNWENHTIIMETIPNSWEEEKIGIAGTPIKTEKGWLLFYHAVDKNHTYRLGIAMLDLNNPTKVLMRQSEPILEPELSWEKDGWIKNVVFSCGAIEMDDKYIVYYGGADTVIGAAYVSKEKILNILE